MKAPDEPAHDRVAGLGLPERNVRWPGASTDKPVASATPPATPAAITEAPDKPMAVVAPPRHPTRTEPPRFNHPSGQNGGDRYLNAVRDDIMRNLVYPPAARYIGIHGTAQFALLVDRQGRLLHLRLLESSGADILDKAGRDMIEHSVPIRPLPPDIKGNEVELVLTVIWQK